MAGELKKLMDEGKLIGSEHVVKLIKAKFAQHGNAHYLLDGFPRN
jgi:adenylate kinase family enzyme